MREVITKVYKFEELSPEAQRKAVEDYRNRGWCWDSCESEMLKDSFKERLEEYGFYSDVTVEFSLSYCQGDGVAFYGTIDFDKWLEGHKDSFSKDELRRLNWLNETAGISVKVTRNSYGYHYSHWNTMNAEVVSDWSYYASNQHLLEEVLDKVNEMISDEIKDLSRKFEKEGYEEIEYRESFECIKENIEANEYEYEVDGSIY